MPKHFLNNSKTLCETPFITLMVKKGQICNWSIDMFTVILLFSKSCLAHPLTKLDTGVQMNIIRGNFKTVMRQVFTCFHMIRRRKKFYAYKTVNFGLWCKELHLEKWFNIFFSLIVFGKLLNYGRK